MAKKPTAKKTKGAPAPAQTAAAAPTKKRKDEVSYEAKAME